MSQRHRRVLADDLRGIFAAPTRSRADIAAQEVADRWRATHPTMATRLEEDLDTALTCLSFQASHRRRIRRTNGLERVNQELERRTRVVRIFPNRESLLRLVTALAMEKSDEWVSGRRYLDLTLGEPAQEVPIAGSLATAAD